MKITKIFTVVLAVAAAVSCAPKKTATEELPVALQLYSVRGDLEADFLGTLCKVSEIGYDGVEFAGLYGHEPAQIKKWCEPYYERRANIQPWLDAIKDAIDRFSKVCDA